MSDKTICSLFFQPLETRRTYSKDGRTGFLGKWEIPAAEPGKYHTIKVSQAHEAQRDGSRAPFITPVYADELANDLVTEWRDQRRFTEFGRPGVFVCAGDEPTPEEIEFWTAQQTLWAEAHYNEAMDMFANGGRAGITKLHRDCARWLGRMSEEWVYSTEQIKLKPCPMCTEKVDERAVKCGKCGNIIDFDRFFQYEQKRMEAEAKLMEMRKRILGESEPNTAPKPINPPIHQPNKQNARV